MQLIAILQRAVPFGLTFAAGLFIASFFVSIAAPSFEFKKNRSWGKRHDCHKTKRANREMRNEILNLKMELEESKLEIERLSEETGARRVMPITRVDPEPVHPSRIERRVTRGSDFR
ncbi:hypothetical protein BH24ACI3_BH24ACI3_09670 [soil metagenome]